MSEGKVLRVKVVSGRKLTEFENRLNEQLESFSPDDIVGIDLSFDTDTYGLIGVVRYLAEK